MMPGIPPPLPPTRTPRVQDNMTETPTSRKTTAIVGGSVAAVAVLTCLALLLASWILKRRATRRAELLRVSDSKFSEFSFENSVGEASSIRSVDAADECCKYIVLNSSSSHSGPSTNTSRTSPGSYAIFPNVPFQHTISKGSQNESQFEDQAYSLTRSSSSYSRSSIETATPRTSISNEGTSEIDSSQCPVHPVACSLYANVKSSEHIERVRAVPVEPGERVQTSRSFWRLAHPVERSGSVI